MFYSRGIKGKIHEYIYPIGLQKFSGKGNMGMSPKMFVKCQSDKEEGK